MANNTGNYKVNFYLEDTDQPEIHTLCSNCAITYPIPLHEVDVAGAWDECELCLIQNVPGWYHEKGHEYDSH